MTREAVMIEINQSNIDALVASTWQSLFQDYEVHKKPISNEKTLCFSFAWTFGRILGYPTQYCVDFERNIYATFDPKEPDRFLDLLLFMDEKYKVAIEFKFPGSNIAQGRAHICRDISRLSWLVNNHHSDVGYFICVTGLLPYINKGDKNDQYATYSGTTYNGETLASGPYVKRELPMPRHKVEFTWENIGLSRNEKKSEIKGRFAWLKPIKIYG